jgi:hypothetical protein
MSKIPYVLANAVYYAATTPDDGTLYDTLVNVVAEMNNYYYSGIGQREIINTKWGAYNAVTGYYSNIDNSNGLKRMDSILYGSKAKKIELAGNILMNM